MGEGRRESLAGHVRSFLPPSGLGSEPGSPCPVIWAQSPGPAHTLQLTRATPAGSGLRHCCNGSDCRGLTARQTGALIWICSLSSHSGAHGPIFLTHCLHPSGPPSDVFLSSGPRGCPVMCPLLHLPTSPLRCDPAFLGYKPSGPHACCLCGQLILESQGGPAAEQGLELLRPLKGVGPLSCPSCLLRHIPVSCTICCHATDS